MKSFLAHSLLIDTRDDEDENEVKYSSSDTQNFIPSSSFDGKRPRYLFKNGDEGVGYYLDSNAVLSDTKTVNTNESVAEVKEVPKMVTVDIEKSLNTLSSHLRNEK